ncbi:hypothetical protein BRC96_00725 [Halobacteriales archaeon QS_6_64_34]|nr:MAG: hypothetical protein BRC96_00725 [Halobacteriales archaeon QS_6_64_34]
MVNDPTRRRFIQTASIAGAVALAGCDGNGAGRRPRTRPERPNRPDRLTRRQPTLRYGTRTAW